MEEEAQNGKLAAEGRPSVALRGIVLAVISGLASASTFAVVRYVTKIYPGQLAAYRFWCISALTLPQLIWNEEQILGPPSHRFLILVMAFVNATGVFLIFLACRYLPLGEAAVVYDSYPVFVTVAGKYFLNETFGILHVTTLLTTVAGLVLTTGMHQQITGNSFTTENIYGIAAALGALASFTINFILFRKMKKTHYSVLVFNGGMLGVIESIVLTAFLADFTFHYSDLERGFVILLGFLSYAAFLFSVVSVQYLEAGPVTVLKSSSDVFSAFLFQSVIFGDVPKPAAIFGAVLVCVSITLLGVAQKYKTLMPNKCLNLF